MRIASLEYRRRAADERVGAPNGTIGESSAIRLRRRPARRRPRVRGDARFAHPVETVGEPGLIEQSLRLRHRYLKS